MTPIHKQRSGGNYGGGFLEFLLGGGNRSPAGYDASYSRGAVRYNDPSYRQAAYGPAGAFEAPVQRGMWCRVKQVSRKAEWPAWTPPPEMLRRRPDLPRHMEGGPANPLGARALYLGSSLYRIHGTQRAEHDRPKRVV
jgi:lipoprotein-anchoring transpeptidase ErfK/SrfK